MSYVIEEKNSIYSFSKNHEPVLTVPQNSVVTFKTYDCFSNQIQTGKEPLKGIDFQKVNPAAGPLYIDEAEPGGILKVTIIDIRIKSQGVMFVEDGFGVLHDQFKKDEYRVLKILEDTILFNEKIKIPVKPMIGVIGVAPDNDDINCGTPGSHGGNMDNNMICKGSTLYLPIFIKGALFALGDLHAAMGDGEVCVTGVEVAGEVDAAFEVIQGKWITNPVLENGEYITTIASARTLDEAVYKATNDMAQLLMEKTHMDFNEVNMLMSAAGQAQICQVVDPLRTARFIMPKYLLQGYDPNPSVF